jgi:hypothetical protein
MIVTIHQPEHLPWLGFFHKLAQADCLIVLDTVQYRRRYFQNRNRIRTSTGSQWLTVPLQAGPRDMTRICDVRIARDDHRWLRKNLAAIQANCGHAPHFADHWPAFRAAYEAPPEYLADYNVRLIRFLMAALDIDRPLISASELNAGGRKGDLMLALCRAVGATHYHSGISGRDYLDQAAFAAAGIKLTYQEFHHPIYPQVYEPFEPCMSALDLVFNCGPQSGHILMGTGVPVMAEVFT